ncbi:MAG: penicillin-binding protein 2 [Candidatus Kapabacteria bacterium]|nr:penicillin-binding protein 2 [Candidatus Kapabacteria bacterium]
MSYKHLDASFASDQRFHIFRYAVLAICLIFAGRLAWLQIIQGNKYRLKAEAQAIKQISTEPFRGMIFDRNGRAIVQNAPGFSITITPYEFTPSAARRLGYILGVADSLLWNESLKAARYNKFAATKLSYGRDVSFDIVSKIEELRDSLPGVDMIIDPKRMYAFDGNGAHLLGFTREVAEWELKELGDAYAPGDVTGKAGLEKSYEAAIRGQKGLQFVAVNKNGQKVASFNDGKSDTPGLEGDDLYLGIDTDLQELAEKLLTGARGSVVAIDPATGEILCYASKPDFDLRKFTGKTARSYYNELASDPSIPMLNRASNSMYHPGSTWKPLMTLMALQEGVITPKTKLMCAGGYTYGNRFALCHGGVHGMIDCSYALQVSCNSFYYQLGLKMGVDRFHKYGAMFGFGSRTKVDIPSGEDGRGILPSRAYMDRAYGSKNWTQYALMNWGIGQGEVNVTPLQLAAYTAAIANGGTWNQPHAVRAIYSKTLQRRNSIAYESRKVPINQEYFDIVKKAMRLVVSSGTARGADIPGLDVCGKTGTAQTSGGKQDQSWFICFAPMNDPKIAMVVTGEGKGFGAQFAVPIAQKLLDLYLNRRWPADVARDSTWLIKPGVTPQQREASKPAQPTTEGPFASLDPPKPVATKPSDTTSVASSQTTVR